jgi:hypothetical protein
MKRFFRHVCALTLLSAALAPGLIAQDFGMPSDDVGNDGREIPEMQPAVAALPSSFGGVSLGISLDQAKEDISASPLFAYRGDPDISFLPSDDQPIIRADGNGFLSSGIFQFHDDGLYSITLRLDEERMDYFTMFSDLSEKYGDPDYLDPQQCYWERDGVRMILEKPLTVKYLSMEVFNAIREAGAAEESISTMSRDLFLDNF